MIKDKKTGSEIPVFKYKVRVKKAHGDKYGVLAVASDNVRNSTIIFSVGGNDDPSIKVWNFDHKELITTIESSEMFTPIFLNLVVFRQSSSGKISVNRSNRRQRTEGGLEKQS